MIPPFITNIIGALPWKQIGLAAIALGVILYVRNAEINRADLKTARDDLAAAATANQNLIKEHENVISVLTESINDERKRNQDYDQKIKIIRTGPNGDCSFNSPAINNSIRMRWETKNGIPSNENTNPD